ncbi:MAG: hypothetical protein EOO53_13865 [Gammaproteobacteria bacterium]|nr:MAG: hypothetical protein EOO53_13865 [Gammaproteobacteria bacterium]
MYYRIMFFAGFLGLLSSCGGGGGNGGTTPSPASSQVANSSVSSATSSVVESVSSSVSSSSSSLNPCDNNGAVIFSECMNAPYGHVVGAQYSPTYSEYTETDSTQQVQWSVLDSNSEHNKVLDVTFSDSARKGQVSFGHPGENASVQDLSQFQTGSIQFDIRILNFGSAFDNEKGGVVFALRTDCLWPCAAHEMVVTVQQLDTWVHIELPMSSMIASGLDISKVNYSLIFVPQGPQANLHFQIDNVQLYKGAPVTAGPLVVFKEDFNGDSISKWSFTNVQGNPTANVFASFGAAVSLLWSGSNDTLRFEKSLESAIDITSKNASFQINCWKGTYLGFAYQMIATDINGVTATTLSNNAASLTSGEWYNISANIGKDFDNGFDAKHVSKIGWQFTHQGSSSAVSQCYLDTVRITE